MALSSFPHSTCSCFLVYTGAEVSDVLSTHIERKNQQALKGVGYQQVKHSDLYNMVSILFEYASVYDEEQTFDVTMDFSWMFSKASS